MVSPLELAALQGGRPGGVPRRGVTTYQPRRPMHQGIAPAQQQQQQQQGGSPLEQQIMRAMSTPAAQEAAQKRAQEQAKANQPEAKGLGRLVNNPITRVALDALDTLSIPRRAIEVGYGELAAALPEWTEWLPPLWGTRWIDEEKVRNNPQGVMERIGDSEFGMGNMIKPTGNQWLDRGLGFAGDVALDPLSYVSGVALKAAEIPEVAAAGAKAAKARQLGKAAEESAAALADKALGSGSAVDDLARMMAESNAGKLSREAEAATTAYDTAKAAPGSTRRVPLHPNRGSRMTELAVWAQQNPEMREKYAAEVGNILKRGWGAAKSPELRESLGLIEPKLRMLGQGVPGTGKVAELMQSGGGAVRGLVNSQLPETWLTKTARKGMGPATLSLIKGTGDQAKALEHLAISGTGREGKIVEYVLNNSLTRAYKDDFKGLKREGLDAMFHEAETVGDTPINRWLDRAADTYEKYTGKKVARLGGSREGKYVPHVLSDKWRRMLKNGGKPELEEFLRLGGFAQDDLLETSGYLEKARVFTPNANGTPREFELRGKKFTIKEGTAKELNTELNKIYPELGGDFVFYETNPLRVLEKYAGSLGRSAQAELALQRAADAVTPFTRRVEGSLDDVRLSRLEGKEWDQEDLYRAMREGQDPMGAPVEPEYPTSIVQPAPSIPGSNPLEEEMFRKGAVVDEPALEARQKFLRSPESRTEVEKFGTQTSEAVEKRTAEIVQERTALAKEIRSTADPKTGSGPIKRRVATLKNRLAKIENQLKTTERVIDKSPTAKPPSRTGFFNEKAGRALYPQSREELTNVIVESKRLQQKAEQEMIDLLEGVEGKITAAQAASRKEIDNRLAIAKDIQQRAMALADDPDAITAEVARRRVELNAPVERARADVEAARAHLREGSPITPKRQAQAEEIVAKANKGSRHAPETVLKARQDLAKVAAWKREAQNKLTAANTAFNNAESRADRLVVQGSDFGGINVQRAMGLKSETEKDFLRELERSVKAGNLRNLSERASENLSKFQTTLRSDKTKASKAIRVQIMKEQEDALEPLTEIIAHESGKQRLVLEDTRKRLRIMDSEVDGLMRQIHYDSLDATAAQAREHEVAATVKKLGTRKKIKNIKAFQEYILDPITKLAVDDPGMTDASISKTRSLLTHAAEVESHLIGRDATEAEMRGLRTAARTGTLQPVFMAALSDQWTLMSTGARAETGSIIMDAELAKMFNSVYELSKEPGLFSRTLTAFTNLFKTYATLSPGFHVRNALSAMFMNFSDGVGAAKQLEGILQRRRFARGGDEWLENQSQRVQDAFAIVAGSGSGGRFHEAGVADVIDSTARGSRTYNRLASNKLVRSSQRAGAIVEDSVRLGMALDSIDRGEAIQSAIERISRVHFDYSQVSKMDETMKGIIPFWTFMSRNLPLQITQMWTKPKAYAIYESLVRNFSTEDLPFTPQYMKDSGAFNTGLKVPKLPIPIVGAAAGLPILGSPDMGFTRLKSDVADIEHALSGEQVMGLASNVNPWFTAPLEYGTRQDFYTGQRFEKDKNFEDLSGPLGALIKLFAGPTGNLNEAGQVDPRFMNALEAVIPPLGRAQRLTPSTIGSEQEPRARQLEAIIRFMGGPMRTVTPQQQQNEAYRRYYEQKDQLQHALEIAQAKAS